MAADRSLMLWDLSGAGGLARRAHDSVVGVDVAWSVWISPTGRTVAILGEDVHLIDLGSGTTVVLPADQLDDAQWAAFSPDG